MIYLRDQNYLTKPVSKNESPNMLNKEYLWLHIFFPPQKCEYSHTSKNKVWLNRPFLFEIVPTVIELKSFYKEEWAKVSPQLCMKPITRLPIIANAWCQLTRLGTICFSQRVGWVWTAFLS